MRETYLRGREVHKPSSWQLEVGRKEASAGKSRSHQSCLMINYCSITYPPFSGFVVLSPILEGATISLQEQPTRTLTNQLGWNTSNIQVQVGCCCWAWCRRLVCWCLATGSRVLASTFTGGCSTPLRSNQPPATTARPLYVCTHCILFPTPSVRLYINNYIPKHIQGQLDPPVCNVTFLDQSRSVRSPRL